MIDAFASPIPTPDTDSDSISLSAHGTPHHVTYWSCYHQEWTHAFAKNDIPDREWTAADASDLALFAKLSD
jgi:hypothetical protein